MKAKRVFAFFTAMLICLTLIPPCTSAADTVKLIVLDCAPQEDGSVCGNLVDGNKRTSWGLDWKNGTTTAYVVLEAPNQITAKGYSLTTGEDARSYRNRNPRDWKLYGCNNYDKESKTGGEWILLHAVNNDSVLQDINSKSYNYYFDNDTAYKFYKLEITANKGNTYLKIGEFQLLETIGFIAVDGKSGVNNNENYANLFDGSDTTKYCVNTGDVYAVAKLPYSAVVTGYTFTTGNDTKDNPGRNPKSWVLYGSNDYNETSKEGTWNEIHSVTNDTTLQAANYTSYSYTVDDNAIAYKYYKFAFNEVQSGTLMQLSEIQAEFATVIHNWADGERVEPTCTKAGSLKQTCTDCGEERTREIAAVGHTWADNGQDDPTCTKVGLRHQVCTACGATQDIEIPIIDHTWVYDSTAEPTCFDTGMSIEKCTGCGAERSTELPPLGHIKGENGLCGRCGKHVIRIDETYYFNLSDAANAVKQDETIEILQNIIIESEAVIQTDCTIELNGNTIKQLGNARVFNVSKALTLKDSSEGRTGMIIGGSASDGGGVYIAGYAALNLVGVTVSDCTATVRGGGVYVERNGSLNMSDGAVVQNCRVSNNVGGGIFVNGTTNITGSKVLNCSANYGAGVYVDKYGTLHFDNSIVEGCTAKIGGGGIYTGSGSNAEIRNDSVIRNNTAGNNYGGGLCATGGSTMEIIHSKIENNTANEGAGILANSDSKISMSDNAEVTQNSASSSGGGVQLSAASLTVANGKISNNSTNGNGGGIYANKSSSITFEGGEISENRAVWGGGVYLHNGSDMVISGESYISGNAVTRNGGGVLINDVNGDDFPTLTMTGGSISLNQCMGERYGDGGGICGQKKAVIRISDGSVDSNTANNGGGIVLFSGSDATISGGNIIGNIAKSGKGGGIYVDAESSLALTGGSVAGNSSVKVGGGIFNNSAKLTVENDPHVTENYTATYTVDNDGNGNAEPVSKNNIYMAFGTKISGSLKEVVAPPIIYVTLEDKSQDITDTFETDCSSYIYSDDENYAVVYDEQSKTHKLADSVRITLIEFEGETETIRYDTVAKGHPYTPSYEPWRAGYRFLGWYKDGMRYDFGQAVNEPMTLTAKWALEDEAAIELTSDSYIVTGPIDSAVICIASYDADGAVVDTVTLTATESNRQMLLSKLNLTTENATIIKAFLWDGNMIPLCDNAFISIS